MPLQQVIHHNSGTKIGVWHITEKQDFFEQQVSLTQPIQHEQKRLQHLAGRLLLKTLFPNFPTELITIADTKKPFLPNEAYHFSISHCGAYAAAIVSEDNRVGVDIELPTEKVLRIQHKFLVQQELYVLEHLQLPLLETVTTAWSAKEAVFKWYGLGKVDFKAHMQIVNAEINPHAMQLSIAFLKNDAPQILQIQAQKIGNLQLTWLVTEVL
jgi:phosphopantetheinyl transferase